MPFLTRRRLLKSFGALILSGMATAGYAAGVEPFWYRITRYRLTPPNWPQGLTLKLAIVADIHAVDPWMSLDRLGQIVADTNALKPDAILLLGDYVAGYRVSRFAARIIPAPEWADVLAKLDAPLGRYAVLGNHDWWDDHEVQARGAGPTRAHLALQGAGVPVLENDVTRLTKDGRTVWLAGLGDQWAFWPRDRRWRGRREIAYRGIHDLPGTLAKVTDDAPVILMAHEPDIFPHVPARVALTLSGHTHGGQVTLAGYAPIVPSRYGRRYRYGHIVEDGRNLIVSAGLGCSGLPVRFGARPEVVLVELG
jgi:hypothetical protein